MVQRYVYPLDLTGIEAEVEKIASKLGISKAEAIRESIKHYAEYVEGLEVIEYRDLTKEQAKKEVQEFLKGKERVTSDEISNVLRIDMSMVNEVLMELWQEEEIEPEDTR